MLNDFLNQIRVNSRLRMGIWLILGICWLYGVLELRDYLQDVRDKHRAALENVSRMRVQKSQTEWLTRVEQAKAMAAHMESRLLQASSSGLAQAVFEDWIRSSLTDAGVSQPQIKVVVVDEANQADDDSKALPPDSDLWKVRANLSFVINPENLVSLVSKIEFSERQVAFETLKIRSETVPQVEMQLVAYVKRQADATQGDKPLVSVPPKSSPPADPVSVIAPPGLQGPATLPAATLPLRNIAPPNVLPQHASGVPTAVINPFAAMAASAPPQTTSGPVPIVKNPFMP